MSRISPTMMMFGSWRRNAFSAAANDRPTPSFTSTWLIPSRLYSTGSSAVMTFTFGVFTRDSAEYRVVVFPEPVGPVTSTMPYGFRIADRKSFMLAGSKPSFSRSMLRFVLSRMRMTIFSPKIVGSEFTRRSMVRLMTLILMRPSCGTRRSAMSRSAMILSREVMAALNLYGGAIIS